MRPVSPTIPPIELGRWLIGVHAGNSRHHKLNNENLPDRRSSVKRGSSSAGVECLAKAGTGLLSFSPLVSGKSQPPPGPGPISGSGTPIISGDGVHQTRRQSGGARREASERVTLKKDGAEIGGWTLNISRGGLRMIVEDPVKENENYDLVMADGTVRFSRIVWLRDMEDGQIVGVQFLDTEGSVPPPPGDPEDGP